MKQRAEQKQHLLFWSSLKSGESSMTVPSLYHSTLGEGTPFTRHSSTTSWPSSARTSWRLCWDKMGVSGGSIPGWTTHFQIQYFQKNSSCFVTFYYGKCKKLKMTFYFITV